MTLEKGDKLRLFPLDDGMEYEVLEISKNTAYEGTIAVLLKEEER